MLAKSLGKWKETVIRKLFFSLSRESKVLSNFPEVDSEARNERPVMQDPSATYIEVDSGSTAILPCFSLGAPAPITR